MRDDDPVARWEAHVKRTLFPQVDGSAVWLGISPSGQPDAKFCVELGAAILYDKPILVVCPRGRTVPPGLRRIAHAVVEDVEWGTEAGREAVQRALAGLLPELGRGR